MPDILNIMQPFMAGRREGAGPERQLVAITAQSSATKAAATATPPMTTPVLSLRRSSAFRSSSMMMNRKSTITAPA